MINKYDRQKRQQDGAIPYEKIETYVSLNHFRDGRFMKEELRWQTTRQQMKLSIPPQT